MPHVWLLVSISRSRFLQLLLIVSRHARLPSRRAQGLVAVVAERVLASASAVQEKPVLEKVKVAPKMELLEQQAAVLDV